MTTYLRYLVVTLLFLATVTPALAVEPQEDVPRVSLPLMDKPPTIDGVIKEDEWAGAARSIGFLRLSGGVMDPREAFFYVGSDGKTLFLAIRTELPPDDKILTRAVPDPKLDIRATFKDDSLEFVLDPKRGRPEQIGTRWYYHIITNARGALYDRRIDPDNKPNPMDTAWRLPEWRLKYTLTGGFWNVEVAIPLASLETTAADLKTPWGIRVARNWRRPSAQSQWTPYGGSYIDQTTMPIVRWDPSAPVVQVERLHKDWKEASIAVSIRNPHDKPIDVRASLSDAWHRNPPKELSRQITVAPGQTERVELDAPDGGPEGLHYTTIDIGSPDGAKTYYFRKFKWNLHRTERRWDVGEQQKETVGLFFKYYPYHSKIRLRLDLSPMDVRDKVTGATARIFPVDEHNRPTGAPLWRKTLALDKFVSEGIHDIPDLLDGRYTLSVRLTGGSGVPEQPIVEIFHRRHFEWERNRLGVSDKVMPPFTPLEVDGKTVKCVLRELTHGDDGFWASVKSQGRELLTGPIRCEVVASGPDGEAAVQTIAAGGWSVEAATPTAVTGRASWQAGPLKAETVTEYDYDGMMLVTLNLEPTGANRVHRLTLNIPVSEAEARYMHAVGDGLRHNYAGFVPTENMEGKQVVWDSSRGNKLDIISTFYPYLWVGGGERGVCWFADTDRDWILDDETPTVELSRVDGTLMMRVHFITKPSVITRKRQIVFGLQATPTKPMPEGWRRWTGRIRVPGGRAVSWLGSTPYWGGIMHDLFPFERRYEYWDAMRSARETGQADPAFMQHWLKVIARYAPRENPGRGRRNFEFYKRHLQAGMRSAAGTPWEGPTRLFGYTNARGIGYWAAEFAVFQDEWLRYGWFNRNWDTFGGISYDVSPSESFVDFAVWQYKTMIDYWTDGVYWDNMFLSGHFDPVVGNAWIDDAGKVRPGLGLFHLRNLVKRTAIMHWQQSAGKHPNRLPLVQLSHMTNTMIVPVLSFGNCNMDWEWRYGMTDFQDRFSPELTVAQTIGRQVGAWGTILPGGHFNRQDPKAQWVFRTRLGVCLVHELQNFDYLPEPDVPVYTKLFDFGYGLDDCTVWNYWEPPHPVSVEGTDGRTLAMARNGAAVVVVTDYGDQPGERTCTLTVDLKALGLNRQANAADFESGKPVERIGDGKFRFKLKKHDFRMLRIE